MSLWFRYSLRQLSLHKARSLLTVLGIAFGVALVYAVSLSQKTVVTGFTNFVNSLSGQTDLQITKLAAAFNQQELKKAKLPETAKVAPSLIKNDVLLRQQPLPVIVFGLNKKNHLQAYKVVSGHFPQNKQEILVGRDFAQLNRLKINSLLSLKGASLKPKQFKVTGFIDSSGIGSVFGGRVVVMPLGAAQDLYHLKQKINHIGLQLKDTTKLRLVKKKLQQRFTPAFEINRPAEKGTTAESIVASTKAALQSFAYLALFSGALIVLNTMRVSIAQRHQELALLRAIGASRWQTVKLTLLEAVLFGVSGSFLGLLFGHYAATVLAQITAATYQLPPPSLVFDISEAAKAIATGIIITFLATAYPAYLASKLHPLQALSRFRQQETKPKLVKLSMLTLFFLVIGFSVYQQRAWLGAFWAFNIAILSFILATTVSLAITVKPFGQLLTFVFSSLSQPKLKLAVKNLGRHQQSSVTAIATLVIAIILTLGIGELRLSDETLFNKYLKQNFQRDLALGNPIPYSVASVNQYPPLPYRLKTEVAKTAGVKKVLPLRIIASKGLGKDLYTIVIDPHRKNVAKVSFDEGELYQAHRLLLKGGYLFLATTLSRQHNLHLNDKVKIKTASGWRWFKVAGVYNELANNGEAIYISYGDLKKYWGESGVDSFFIDLKANASLSKVRARLAKKLAQPLGLTLTSHLEERKRAERTVDSVLRGFDSLVLVTVLIAVLSLTNLGLITILNRQQELGVFQALGASKNQIISLILLEAFFIGLLGGIVGILVGLPLAQFILKLGETLTSWRLSYVFPLKPLLQAVAIALFVPPLAYLYGAYRAIKMPLIATLREE